MKKCISVLLLVLMLASCSAAPSNTAVSDDDTPDIPSDICEELRSDLKGAVSGYDDTAVAVLGTDGKITADLVLDGMVLRVNFADYADAFSRRVLELVEEYDLPLSKITVIFKSGEDNIMVWSSNDGVSGLLTDSYNGANVMLTGCTIQDIVDRYGAMGWFGLEPFDSEK